MGVNGPVSRGKLLVKEREGNAVSAAGGSSKQRSEGAGVDSLPGAMKQKSEAGKGTGKSLLTPEQDQAKQESLKQAELKRKRREELKAAAEAEKSGVLVRKEAETVVEFPEASKPAKSPKKAKKKSKRHKAAKPAP